MKQWIPYELHSHTIHSDGKFTVMGIAEAAKSTGLKRLALTDHNTMAPDEQVEEAMKKTGIKIINAMEWTTFFGHMVVLGADRYVEWRDIGRYDIHLGIERAHKAGGIVGVAHPYRPGGPLCTGCYWEYDVKDWSDVDYIEVWSGVSPGSKESNHKAVALWTRLLNQGYRITATYGLDWHGKFPDTAVIGTTYLLIDEKDGQNYTDQTLKAIKNGKVCISIGPIVEINLNSEEGHWEVGDTVEHINEASAVCRLKIDANHRFGMKNIKKEPLKLVLNSNKGPVDDRTLLKPEDCYEIKIETSEMKWIRGELYQTVENEEVMVAMTNPIYFKNQTEEGA